MHNNNNGALLRKQHLLNWTITSEVQCSHRGTTNLFLFSPQAPLSTTLLLNRYLAHSWFWTRSTSRLLVAWCFIPFCHSRTAWSFIEAMWKAPPQDQTVAFQTTRVQLGTAAMKAITFPEVYIFKHTVEPCPKRTNLSEKGLNVITGFYVPYRAVLQEVVQIKYSFLFLLVFSHKFHPAVRCDLSAGLEMCTDMDKRSECMLA